MAGYSALPRSLAWLCVLASLALTAPGAASAQPAAAVLTLNDTQFRPGETLAMGLTVTLPPGNPPADLLVGVLLPGNQQALFFSGAGQLAGPINVSSPAQFVRFALASPGFSLANLGFFQFTFPATGVPPGTYTLFAALVRANSLLDNRIDPGDFLSLDLRAIVFGSSIQLAPATGPSGTFVNVAGTGFTGSSAITFGAAPVPGVFTSATQLGFLVPFGQTPALPPAAIALAPGPVAIKVNDGPSQTFTVTSPPTSPSPPGTVSQAAATLTGQAIGANRALIDGSLTSLKAQAASGDANNYLDTMNGLVSDLQNVFTQDLASLSTSLDAPTQTALDQALLGAPPPPPAALPVLVVGPALVGDAFLDQRQALVNAGNQAARAAQVLFQVCPLSPSSSCPIAGAAFALTSTLVDLIVGSGGNVIDLRIAASDRVVAVTGDRLTLRLRAGDHPVLSPFIVVRRELDALNPVRLALEINAARTQLNRALTSPSLSPETLARLGRLLQAVTALGALAPRLAGNIALQASQELAVSFSRLGFRCPSDLFATLSVDAQGSVSVIRQAAFDVTRVCDFGLRPGFMTLSETAVSFEVAFNVASYGSQTMGPVRPTMAWASLLLVTGLVLSQWSGRRPTGRRR